MNVGILIAVLLVAMTWCGQLAVARIGRGGPPFAGLPWALFFAWSVPLAVFDVVAWFGPGITGKDDPTWMTSRRSCWCN